MFQSRKTGRRVPALCLVAIALSAGILAAIALAADPAPDAALVKLRATLLADAADARGAACMETVERTRYAPRKSGPGTTCAERIQAAAGSPRGEIEWHNRLRLDVTSGPESEEFAFTNATAFENKDIANILRIASVGRGEFATFLRNVISADAEAFQPRGLEQTPLGAWSAFAFSVPAARSHFLYGGWEGQIDGTATAYRGLLYTSPDASALRRLSLEAEESGDACRVQYAIDYRETRIGQTDIVLPQSSVMDVIYRDGKELHSEAYYSSCRKAKPQTAPAPAASPKPLPPHTRLSVRLQDPIDGETAAAGDPVVGVIRATVKDKQNGVIARAGDRLHGRIAVLEQTLLPRKRWNMAIVFETIERGVGEHGIDQGIEQPATFAPLDDGERGPHDELLPPAELERLRPPGGGYFIFSEGTLQLDKTWETTWETR